MTWLGQYVQLFGNDLLFPEWILMNLLPYCFDSNFSPHTFQTSWPSPVFNPPEFLITFNCPIHKIFAKFSMVSRVWKFENLIFPRMWRAITATCFSLKPHSMLTLWEMWANCLGTSTWRVNSPKITNLWTLTPHCLQLWTTWNLEQNLWQGYVQTVPSQPHR